MRREGERLFFFLLFLLMKGSLSIPLFFFFHLPSEIPLWEWDEGSSYINLAADSPSIIYLEQSVFFFFDLEQWEPGFLRQWLFSAVTLCQQRHHSSVGWCYCWGTLFSGVIQLSTAGHKGCAAEHRTTCCCSTCVPVPLGADLLLMWRRCSTPGCFGHILSTACSPDQMRWDTTAFCS